MTKAKRTKNKAAKTEVDAKSKPSSTADSVGEAVPGSTPEDIKRIRTAKGRRPYFFDDPNIDRLIAMLMALVAEVSVIRERLDTHERLAQENRVATPDEIESYEPPDHVLQERADRRERYIGRILRIQTDELERIARQESEGNIDDIIRREAS